MFNAISLRRLSFQEISSYAGERFAVKIVCSGDAGTDMIHTTISEAVLPRVLIVEDDALIRLTLADFLEGSGFRVLEASTGDEAATILARGGPKIDIVFSDVRMPGTIDGFKLVNWVRERYPKISVFLASGDIGKAHTASELAPGQVFFQKPYDMNVVASQMRATLKGDRVHSTRNIAS